LKGLIEGLNKAFESRIRLGIMSILMVHDQVDFVFLKEALDVTDGNLASHLAALDKLGYIAVIKKFVGKKPNTSYSVTKVGETAFKQHLDALERLIGKK